MSSSKSLFDNVKWALSNRKLGPFKMSLKKTQKLHKYTVFGLLVFPFVVFISSPEKASSRQILVALSCRDLISCRCGSSDMGSGFPSNQESSALMMYDFNPFSLINALADSDLRNYWASSGATSLLPKFVDDMEIRLKDFDNCALLSTIIETSDVTGGGPELFLYQSGYLTIKGYMNGTYLLGIPNFEVKQALSEIVLPTLAMRKSNDIQSTQAFLNLHLSVGNLPETMKCLKALVADVPYSNKKLACMDMEERYRLILSTIFNAIGCRVEVEKMIATGRIDMVVETTNFIYVLELKLTNNGGIDAATEQMKAKQYAEPFKADKRRTIALAIELDDKGKGLVDWKEV